MEQEVILIATVTLVILVVIIIIFFMIFQSKKNQFILERMETEKRVEQEIVQSQIEIREQSLKNIAWELHDNVGQLLSIAKMQLSLLKPNVGNAQVKSIEEISTLMGECLQEIRSLSKTLNQEVVHNLGLVKAIAVDLERFNKLNFLDAKLLVKGEEKELPHKDEIILFRILQEFFTNAIKHSKAKSLRVELDYLSEKLIINARDNGVGFNIAQTEKGSGLLNMKSRARLIGASYALESKENHGVSLTLEYKFNTVE